MRSQKDFRFESKARRPVAIAAIGTALVLSLVLLFVLDALWWLAILPALAALPATYEAWKGNTSELTIKDGQIAWQSSRGGAQKILLSAVEQADIRLRMDFSRKVTLILRDSQRIRIPPDCVPPGDEIQTALDALGVKVRLRKFI